MLARTESGNANTQVRIGSTGAGCGEFLCESMAYLDAWYADYLKSDKQRDKFQKTEVAGFTHIGQPVMTLGGTEALLTQVREVIKHLEPNY